MNLWAFGDSFIESPTGDNFKDQWACRTARELKCEFKPFGKCGTSLDWVYKHLEDNRDNIQENDIVLITLTGLERRWFKEEFPGRAFWRSSPTGDRIENKAYKLYTLYLDYQEPYKYYLLHFLHSLDLLSEKLKLRVLIFSAFPDVEEFLDDKLDKFHFIEIAKGSLLSIMLNEYDPDFLVEKLKWPKDIQEGEATLNHMLKSNHIILSNKVIDFIRNGTPLDLVDGFKQHVINQECYKNRNFCDYEVFGYPLNTKLPHPYPEKEDQFKNFKGPGF